MSDNFTELNSSFNITNEVLEFALAPEPWHFRNGFNMKVVPEDIWSKNQQIAGLVAHFSTSGRIVPLVIKMSAFTFYRLHTDEVRAAALNVLLKGNNSISFFAEELPDEEDRPFEHEVFQVDPVDYQHNKMILFNTQKLHGVLNMDEDRYIFSLGFNFPLDYDTIKEFCLENNL